jgi:hypothetical protein
MTIDLSGLYKVIVDGLNWIVQFLYDLLMYFPRLLWSWIVNGAEYAVDLVPDPCCFQSFVADYQMLMSGGGGGSIGGIDVAGGIIYMMGLFDVQTGVGIMMCALVARFILRRIPVIG